MTRAWVLRGGASFGAAQVGMARALLESGCHPDMLYGASAGALNAAWLAADPTLQGVAALGARWLAVKRSQVFPLRPWVAARGVLGRSDHIVSPGPLERWLRSANRLHRLEDGALALTVVTTDLETGEEVLLDRGPTVKALMASSAMPGVFPPVRLAERWLIDGSIAMDTPIGPAVAAGASEVWVLQSVPAGPVTRPRGALDVMLRSSAILLSRHHDVRVGTWSGHCRLFIVPVPLVRGVSPFDFSHSAELIEAAYRLTREWLPQAQPVAPGTNHYGQEYEWIGNLSTSGAA